MRFAIADWPSADRVGNAGICEHGEELVVNPSVRCHDRADLEPEPLAEPPGHAPARFAHDQRARGDVPRLDPHLPVGVDRAGGDHGLIAVSYTHLTLPTS